MTLKLQPEHRAPQLSSTFWAGVCERLPVKIYDLRFTTILENLRFTKIKFFVTHIPDRELRLSYTASMRLLLLQLGLFAAFYEVHAISNKLLEDYERKLNSINDRLALKRTPGKHRWKRYRCIEEYVDEHGNVIEEGREHVTTPAPVTAVPVPKRKSASKSHRAHGVKNTPVVVPGKTTATKGLKVTLVKKKRKSKTGRRERVENRLPLTDEEMYLKRVYPTTTTTTTSVAPTTELIEEDSVDERIMKKYFQPSRTSMGEQQRNNLDIKDRMEETAIVTDTLAAPTLSTLSFEDSDVSDRFVDREVNDEEERPAYRRQRNRGGVNPYAKGRADYDTNYDDYNYIDDELPFVRRRIGRRRMRKYLAYPSMRYPGRRGFTFTKVPPLPANYFATPRPAAFPPYIAVTVAPATVGILPPQKLRAISLAPHREPQLSPPPTPLPVSPTLPQPPPIPLAAPPSLPPPVPLAAPPAQSQTIPLAAPPASKVIQMEESTPETCQRMRRLAATFGITDISDYAKRNCRFLQTFAPGYTCEQIVHFVNSCDKSHFS
ncbi:hypothetical protein Y032_0026g1479 [Ancylostoma ceylanicum]|uniref:aECM cysteine-cradle domain-containing protein n=1 Tax=Ancylostoma ceylanicum TaxID=53326 RepID=A0A016UU45_9BILA|nr:hypothetical protein Y032_0026g1479 [Ancylostoma ceylanicum]